MYQAENKNKLTTKKISTEKSLKLCFESNREIIISNEGDFIEFRVISNTLFTKKLPQFSQFWQ